MLKLRTSIFLILTFVKKLFQYVGWLITGLATIVLVWAGVPWLAYRAAVSASQSLKDTLAISGTLGDTFGVVNALFTALAFALLIWTAYMQKEELGLQRKELQSTRGEMEKQNKTLDIQRFENTFFHLVTLHHELARRAVELSHGSRHYKKIGFVGLREVYATEFEMSVYPKKEEIEEKLSHAQGADQHPFVAKFHNYFRHLYRMTAFVDTATALTDDEKRLYIGIMSAQLSSDEFDCLVYNCAAYDEAAKLYLKYDIFREAEKGGVEAKILAAIKERVHKLHDSKTAEKE